MSFSDSHTSIDHSIHQSNNTTHHPTPSVNTKNEKPSPCSETTFISKSKSEKLSICRQRAIERKKAYKEAVEKAKADLRYPGDGALLYYFFSRV